MAHLLFSFPFPCISLTRGNESFLCMRALECHVNVQQHSATTEPLISCLIHANVSLAFFPSGMKKKSINLHKFQILSTYKSFQLCQHTRLHLFMNFHSLPHRKQQQQLTQNEKCFFVLQLHTFILLKTNATVTNHITSIC